MIFYLPMMIYDAKDLVNLKMPTEHYRTQLLEGSNEVHSTTAVFNLVFLREKHCENFTCDGDVEEGIGD